MELTHTEQSLLDLIEQPAFLVQNGRIVRCNSEANKRNITCATSLSNILADDAYNAFTGEQTLLPLNVDGISCRAVVRRLDNWDLFLLEPDNTQTQLQSLALAAQHLRSPLGGIMAIADILLANEVLRQDSAALSQTIQLNRSLNQLQRMICDMSDVWQYANQQNIHKQVVDVRLLFQEILEKASAILTNSNVTIHFKGLTQPVFSVVDTQMIERAIYNLLSNAVKYSKSPCVIEAKLSLKGSTLHFSVINETTPGSNPTAASVFSRFMRQPGLEDSSFGMGLGMMLVRSVASAHEGSVYVDNPSKKKRRVTMTLQVKESADGDISSPIIRITDYAGGRDHALMELSDVLPSYLYDNQKY